MDRSLVAGAIGFLAAYAAERLLTSLSADIKRYEKLRMMSGDPPLARSILGEVGKMIGGFGASHRSEAIGLFTGLQNDLIRYARLRGM